MSETKIWNDHGESFAVRGFATPDGEPRVKLSVDTGDDYGWLALTLEQTERAISALVNARTAAIEASKEQ